MSGQFPNIYVYFALLITETIKSESVATWQDHMDNDDSNFVEFVKMITIIQ